MWLLVIDRQYYPSVEEFDSKAGAEQARDEFLADTGINDEYSQYDGAVYVAEVAEKTPVRTDH